MAKALWIEDEEQFDQRRSAHPGCMSGIFHALDYHYWKILPHRKHEDLIKHAKGNGRYRRISDDEDAFEVLRLLDAKTSHIQMDRRNRKRSSTQKRSLKARIKALVSEDQDFVPTPKLHRTYSIHHLENNEWVHPIVFYHENGTESPVNSETHSNVIRPEISDSQDILDMFEVDKDVFVNTLKGRSQASVITPKLTKSGSFPTAYRSLMPMKLKDKVNETYTISKYGKIKNLNDDVNRNDVIRLRRISSLNESADRYTRLFDFSVGKEATLRSSRSLKLTSGSESILSAQQPTSFRRNIPIQESHDAYFHRCSSQNNKYAELNSTQDRESLNEVIDKSDHFSENEDSPEANSLAFGKDSHGLKIEEDNNQISQEITQQSPVLVPEYCPPDEKVQISEGLYLSKENLKKEIKTINSKKHMDLSMKDDDFTYVKKILERSGFLKYGFQQTLDPFMFQELESQYFHDPDRFAEDVNILSHHLLLFDLVDEVLLTMYERSSTYYPKKLSSFCHIRPAPTGSRAVDEVWNSMSQQINLKHDLNESLNDIVARYLGSDDGWMSLQSDSECVGLDLEDLILDDVLEELLFELF
ncbi:hypothetical protein L1987_13512 [Smallanthus sonchifolius]|uniref:Uncharacterized protein n=1 Tax=Smallanthus sonchifolius TaxID=185202 RepID=A0ACB9JHM9_9ASTR|nr:hypothetical protein L1987_13512 [Smallanthus sonchifolius]